MASLLYRLGRGAFRRRRTVLTPWLVILAAAVSCLLAFGGELGDDFTIPGSESQQALDTMEETFPQAAGTSAQLVFVAPEGGDVTEPQYAAAIDESLAAARKAPQVATVTDPFETKSISKDGTAALSQVQYEVTKSDLGDGSLDDLEHTVSAARDAGLTAEAGGAAYGNASEEGGHAQEAVGVVIAFAVLAVTFGSLFAAGMPLVTALVGVAVGLTGLLSLTDAVSITNTAPTLALMLGLAVGIDYALFILSRHRSQLARGMSAEESAARATGTAGSAVVFAGLTVVIALCGLTVVGTPFLTVMGLSAAATVLIAVAVAVTLLPALFGLAGERLRPKAASRAEWRELAATGGGERWARAAIRRPLVTVFAAVAALAAVAVPAKDLELALPDNGTAAAGTTQRAAFDLIGEHFGPGSNGSLLVLAEAPDAAQGRQAAGAIAADARDLPGVATVAEPRVDPDSGDALVQLVPVTGPAEPATQDVVQDLRDAAPGWEDRTGAEVSVTGPTAVDIDVSDRLAASMAPFAVIVVGLSLLLLLLVFRSLVVPLQAALGFLLSVAASFGAVVAVFQWGWLADLVGVEKTGPVVSFLPVILMAVLFGLAMDYQVFLVSRMREAYVHGEPPRRAVVTGARHASRVVTAAALIMFAVFAGFVPGADAVFKPMAFALAFGVAVDAFVVRMTLVPALLALFGKAAWWLPGWLHRLLPDLDIEGDKLQHPAPAAATADAPGRELERTSNR